MIDKKNIVLSDFLFYFFFFVLSYKNISAKLLFLHAEYNTLKTNVFISIDKLHGNLNRKIM